MGEDVINPVLYHACVGVIAIPPLTPRTNIPWTFDVPPGLQVITLAHRDGATSSPARAALHSEKTI